MALELLLSATITQNIIFDNYKMKPDIFIFSFIQIIVKFASRFNNSFVSKLPGKQ